MTLEVAAAVRGALAAGVEEVIVNDSHDGMKNILIDDLPDHCRLISGSQKDLSMMHGVDEPGVVAAFFTGYHARAGTPRGVLAHTYIGAVTDFRIDGTSVGEYGVNAVVAGDFGVPVTLVTGDDITIEQTRSLLGDAVIGAVVKKGIATQTADNISVHAAIALIESSARRAVEIADQVQPLRISNARIEVSFNHPELTDMAALSSEVERVGNTTVGWTAENGVHLMQVWRGMLGRVMTRAAL